jgi:hypothetical protein
VGVSEHVTYWNQLGWSDPFSASAYTDRQNAYGNRFHLDSVYTPQMVINGEAQIVGSDKAALLHAIQKQPLETPLSIHILSASKAGNAIDVTFSVQGNLPKSGAEIFAILAENSVRSSVLRGENSGSTLEHVSVARAIDHVATIQSSAERTVHIPVPTSSTIPEGQGSHLILFAQATGFGQVLGVDTRPL